MTTLKIHFYLNIVKSYKYIIERFHNFSVGDSSGVILKVNMERGYAQLSCGKCVFELLLDRLTN